MIIKAQIEGARRKAIQAVNEIFANLLANPDTFAAELSEPVKTVEEIEAEGSKEPEVPTSEEINEINETVEKLKTKLDLKPEGEAKALKEVDEAIWERTIKAIFQTEKGKPEWSSKDLAESLKKGRYEISNKHIRRLDELEKIREMMKDGKMGLAAATSQAIVIESEKIIITDYALKQGIV